MDQQKASALTYAVSCCPSTPQSKRCSSRMVVAPSRWRQKAAKSRNPNKFRELVHRIDIQRTMPTHDIVAR